MISQAIYSILYANASVKGVVGTKIYPNKALQTSDLPFIVYRVISKVPTDSKTNGTGFDRYRIQVDCYHSTYTNCEILAGYIRTALDRVSGSYGSLTLIQTVYEDENDVPLNYEEDSAPVFMKAVDFMIIAK